MANVTSVITKLARLTGQLLCKMSHVPANMSDGMDSSIVTVSSDVIKYFGTWNVHHNGRP
jgi:hypothetical protein